MKSPWRRRADLALWDSERQHAPAAPWPTTVIYRLRYEILLAASALSTVVGLQHLFGTVIASSLIGVVVGATLSVPALRALAGAIWWHVVTPHRIRRCCSELGIYGRNGRLPIIVKTRSTLQGQAVTIWCRAGTARQDFVEASAFLRTACWAEAVHVEPHPRGEPFLILVIDRRPGAPFSPDDRGQTGSGTGDSGQWDHDGNAARVYVPAPRTSTWISPLRTTI